LIHKDIIPIDLLKVIEEQLDTNLKEFEIPPPVFLAMKGEFVSFNLKSAIFRCRFPVLNEQLNPYRVMQGGIIAAAIDNTIGPLSMLIAPPNITRKMEVKYFKSIKKENEYIYVTAQFIEQKKRFLYFESIVDDESGNTKYATAKSAHWIV
jgi:acyl-coenzyme A thioesterase PaaI-like protein